MRVGPASGAVMRLFFDTPVECLKERDAKRDPRLQASGRLTGFRFNGSSFPLEPKTAFYDWLYINAIYPHREWLLREFEQAQRRKWSSIAAIETSP